MDPAEMWSRGDYAAAGDRWAGASRDLVAAHVSPGDVVLDVACGPGALAIAAARVGARVSAVDVSPALLDVARERAAAVGAQVAWIEADMTAIPRGDAEFDLVASAFGCMFAPEPRAMAAELVRLVRPGGRAVALAWAPDSAFGAMGPLAAQYLSGTEPSPTEFWADPDKAASLFAGLPVETSFATRVVDVAWPDEDTAVREILDANPAWLAVRAAVEPAGRWPELADRVRGLLRAAARTDADGFLLPVQYVETTALRVS